MARDLRSGFSITELVLLGLLAERDMYGLEIAKAIGAIISGGRVQFGTVYPLLKDCVRDGLVSEHTKSRTGHAPITFYFLTEAGKGRLNAIANNWYEVNRSVVRLLQRTCTSPKAPRPTLRRRGLGVAARQQSHPG